MTDNLDTLPTTIPEDQIAIMERAQEPIVARASSIVVTSPGEYQLAEDLLVRIGDARKRVKEIVEPAVKTAHEAHQAALKVRKAFLGPLDNAEAILKPKMLTYVRVEQDRRRIEEARAEAAARKAAEEQQLREAEALAAAGLDDAADRVLTEEREVIPPVPYSPPIATKTVLKDHWTVEVTDLMALCRAIVDGKIQPQAVKPNQTFLDQLARAQKDAMDVPGLAVKNRGQLARKSR